MISLSPEIARTIALSSQGLYTPLGVGKKGIVKAIGHLGYVQIDTLAVVARAHHHTLWTRTENYAPAHLDELLAKERSIFEYWSHAASYLPMSDYRFSLPRKKLYREGRSHWFSKDEKVMRYVLDRIKSEGPLMSKDFEAPEKRKGVWYEWKPAKQALEQLFMEGTLMVAGRKGFQKIYDLTERVLPPGIDTSFPSEREHARFLIMKTVNAHGFVSEKEITYLRKGLTESIAKELSRMVKQGELIEVSIGNEKGVYYSTNSKLDLAAKQRMHDTVHILSPFDNSLIQRKRVEKLFGFNYQVECYVTEAKRIYGYFCLPVLYNDSFAARFDPKADRASGTFYVSKLFMEPGFNDIKSFLPLFAGKLKQFALFNTCEKIIIENTEPKGILKELRSLLK